MQIASSVAKLAMPNHTKLFAARADEYTERR